MATITGDRLRSLRLEFGLSQEEVAKKIGISRPAYVNYEQGKSRPVRKLKELSEIFNASTDYILGRTDVRHHFLGNPEKPGHFAHDAYMQPTNLDVAWNPPPEFFTNPETGKRIADMNLSDTHKRIILASKDLSPEELDRIADLVEAMAKAHRK